MGRFHNVPLEKRLCQLCNSKEIEDEQHFLCVCPIYNDYRKILFDSANILSNEFCNLSIIDKFTFVMKYCQKNVIKYVNSSWNKRKGILFVS